MVQGLLMELEDYNCWSIAEAAAHSGPHRLQHRLSRPVWDEQQLLARHRHPAASPGPRPPPALVAVAAPPPVPSQPSPPELGMPTQMSHRDYNELQLPY